MLVVAYPDQPGMPTEFEFQYWVGPYDGGFWERIGSLDFEGKDGEGVLVAFIGMIILAICVLCCLCYIVRKCSSSRTQIGV